MTPSAHNQPPTRLALGTRRDIAWLAAISTALLLALLPFSSYIVAVPFLRDEWAMSNAEAAIVFSAYLVGSALSSAFLLPVTDRIPARRVLFVSVAVMAVSNALFPLLANDVWSAMLLRCAAGAGHIGAYIPGVRLVSLRFAGARRGTAVGAFVSIGFIGTTGSYAVTGWLLDLTDSWRSAYLIVALAGLVGVAIALYILLERRSSDEGDSASPATGRLSLSVLRARPILLLNLAYALHTAELYLARLWLPLLLVAALVSGGRDPRDAAVMAATWAGFMFMIGAVGVFIGGALSDRMGRTAGAALIFAISGAVSFAVGWLTGAPIGLLIALGFVYGFATSADSAIYSTAATELAPPNLIGSTQAVQNLIGFAVGAAAPILAGAILDLFGGSLGWGLSFTLNGVLAVLGVAALLILRRQPIATNMANGRR